MKFKSNTLQITVGITVYAFIYDGDNVLLCFFFDYSIFMLQSFLEDAYVCTHS